MEPVGTRRAGRSCGTRDVACIGCSTRPHAGIPRTRRSGTSSARHVGTSASATLRQILDAMDHAVALDSGFAPALMGHSIESSLRAQDVAAARRYVRTYLTFGGQADFFPVAAYIENQLEADRATSPHGDSMLAAMSGGPLANTWFDLSGWPDTGEVAVALARRFTEPRVVAIFGGDSSFAITQLAYTLAYRGHLREALQVGGRQRPPWLVVEAALVA